MFTNAPERLDLIKMCDDCRVAAVSEQDLDPYGGSRTPMRTNEDYLRERASGGPQSKGPQSEGGSGSES
jgi:hypothetical protein